MFGVCYVLEMGERNSVTNKPATSLADYPDIANQWHPTKNGSLKPTQVKPKSDKKAWFICPKDSTHEWEARLADRTSKGSGCPFCYRRVTDKTSLATLFPEIANDWHPTKNLPLTPETIASKSSKSVWWVCNKGHEYQKPVAQRTHRNEGCSKCTLFGSAQETRIYCELKAVFKDTVFRQKIEGKELDLFIPSINVGIEYDGEFFHRKKVAKDKSKTAFFKKLGIEVIRVREHPLPPLSKLDVITPVKEVTKKDVDSLMSGIAILASDCSQRAQAYISESEFINSDEYSLFMSYFPSPFPENSLAETYPEVAKQWDYEKNYPLTPYNFTHGSKHKAHWICKNGHSHFTTINSKTWRAKSSTQGCKFCARPNLLNLLMQDELFPKRKEP